MSLPADHPRLKKRPLSTGELLADGIVHAVALLAGVVWAGAILGAVVKIALPGRYDRLSVLAYIALGWVGVAAIGPAREALPGVSLWLLVLGGVTYVAGVGFYRWHGLKFHNAIWHLFVAVAAGLHFAAVAVAVAG
jgi:hemolysin III